jgi:Protein of unknown function (DUF1488)
MPLTHLDDDYMIWRVFRRVTFWMADDKGWPVGCSVSNEALHDHAERLYVEGTDVGKIFEAHRPLIERVASDAYDAGVADEEGRVPVTVDALELARRSASDAKVPLQNGTQRHYMSHIPTRVWRGRQKFHVVGSASRSPAFIYCIQFP